MEDRLRAGKVSAAAIAETMGLLNRAANVLNGAVAAGKSVASDIYSVAQGATSRATPSTANAPSGSPPKPPVTPADGAPPAERADPGSTGEDVAHRSVGDG